MVDRVVDGNNLATDIEGVRDEDGFRQNMTDGFGNRRFTVAGRTVKEHRCPGTDRRSQATEHVLADDKLRKGRVYDVIIHLDVADRLILDHDPIVLQDNRCRADIAADFQQLPGEFFAVAGDDEIEGGFDKLARPADFNEFFAAQQFDHFVQN